MNLLGLLVQDERDAFVKKECEYILNEEYFV